jgi:hypothetical protein
MPMRSRRHAGGVVTVRSPHMGQCGGTLVDGPMVASRRQGVVGELMGTTRSTSGNESGGGAHPNSGVSVGLWGGTARWGSTVVELARWSPMMRPKSCTTGGERGGWKRRDLAAHRADERRPRLGGIRGGEQRS